VKIIEVPIFNDDGSVQVTHILNPEEAQGMLQFAINFLTAAGMSTVSAVNKAKASQQQELPFND